MIMKKQITVPKPGKIWVEIFFSYQGQGVEVTNTGRPHTHEYG